MFLLDAKQSLSVRPQTVEEIGEVNQRHTELSRKKPEVCVGGCGWEERSTFPHFPSPAPCSTCTASPHSTFSLFLLASYEWPGYEAIFLYVELHVPVLTLAGQTHS